MINTFHRDKLYVVEGIGSFKSESSFDLLIWLIYLSFTYCNKNKKHDFPLQYGLITFFKNPSLFIGLFYTPTESWYSKHLQPTPAANCEPV